MEELKSGTAKIAKISPSLCELDARSEEIPLPGREGDQGGEFMRLEGILIYLLRASV
jgi:hypothetical protein